MRTAARETRPIGWTCQACGKSMASEGGFKVHLALAHPNGAIQPEGAVTAARRSSEAPPGGEPVEAASMTQNTSAVRPSQHAPGTVGAIWNVKIEAEGAGESISAVVAETFLAGFRDAGARVSTAFHGNTCRYSVLLTVHADGVLTAVLRGIAHFQAAAQAARLPAVTVVGIDAREPASTEDCDS